MRHITYIILLILLFGHCRPKEESKISQFDGKPEVPVSIKKDHEYLLAEIQKFTLFQDSTGRAAVKLSDMMQHHFAEEEDYVLSPLGLLPALVAGNMPQQKDEAIKLSDRLKTQLNHLSAEHQLIKAYVDELLLAATKDGHPEVIEFEKELEKHAKIEEEVLFPTSILIGEYLKLKL